MAGRLAPGRLEFLFCTPQCSDHQVDLAKVHVHRTIALSPLARVDAPLPNSPPQRGAALGSPHGQPDLALLVAAGLG